MKALQKRIKKYCEENNLESPPLYRLLDVMSELGEVSKEVLEISKYGRKPIQCNENLKSEIGDLFYSLITLANSFDIDLEDCLNISFEKLKKRMKEKGSPSSDRNKNC